MLRLDSETKKILVKNRNSKYQRIALTDEKVTFLEKFLATPADQIDPYKVSNLDIWIKDSKFVKVWFKNAFDDASDDKFQIFLKYSANQLQDHWTKDEGRAQIVNKNIFLARGLPGPGAYPKHWLLACALVYFHKNVCRCPASQLPYARHYKPRLMYFLAHFLLRLLFQSGLYCRQFMH